VSAEHKGRLRGRLFVYCAACCLCATGANKRTELVRKAEHQPVATLSLCRESHSAETLCARHRRAGLYMARSNVVAILERSTASTKNAPRASIADEPVSYACFSDWKRFCFVLRQIASGENGHPLAGFDAQKRAQAILSECGYRWLSSDQTRLPMIAPAAVSESLNALAPVDAKRCASKTKLKGRGRVPSPPASQRGDTPKHRVVAIAGNGLA
jgi:hypothetical protein